VGNPDAQVRVAIDAVPAALSRPVLAAGRAVARVFAARTSDRASLLERLALLIHLVEPGAASPEVRPQADVGGLEGALSLAHSPAQPAVWEALRAATDEFGPTVAIDLRDGGVAVESHCLALLMHEPFQTVDHDGPDGPRAQPGAAEARAVAAELRRRGLPLFVGAAAERHRAGLSLASPDVLLQGGSADPPVCQATAAAAGSGALGLTALALGTIEARRAMALATVSAAVLVEAVRGLAGTET